MKKTIKNKKISSLIIFILLITSVISVKAVSIDIPTSQESNLGKYIEFLYKAGLAIVGITAMGALIYGGMLFMLSGGSPGSKEKGKDYIFGAIAGVILLAGSYIILYTINPDLIKGELGLEQVGHGPEGGGSGGEIQPSAQDIAACQAWCDTNWGSDPNGLQSCKDGCNDPNGYNKDSRLAACNSWCDNSGYTDDELRSCKKGCEDYANGADASAGKYANANMPANCNNENWQDIFSQVSSETGVDKCILQATTAMESSCTKVPKRTYNGRDCSAVQIYASAHCPGQSCDFLEQNPDAAVKCAANYIKSCSSRVRPGNIQDVYAGYNGGCGALGASANCPGLKKWDCNINPGGYAAVPARTAKFESLYNKCKGQ